MDINLADTSFPLVLKQLIEESFSGIVFAFNQDTRKGLIFKEGRLCAIQSNRPDEMLGAILLKQGHITPAANEASLRRAMIERRRQGEILLEQNLIGLVELEQALALQTEKRFGEILGWHQGLVQITLKEHIEKPQVFSDQEFKTFVRRMISSCCSNAVVIASLSPFAAAVPQPLDERLPHEADATNHEFMKHPVHQTLAVSESGAKALLGLYCTGAINFEKNRYQDLIDNLEHLLSLVSRQDPFGTIGVPRRCSAEALKKAYIKIAKEHHPDVYAYAQDARVKQLSTDLFAAIQHAYEEVKRIREGRPATIECGIETNEIHQELLFRQASDALRIKDYQNALDLFRVLAKLCPDNRVYTESYINTIYLRWQATKRGSSLEIKMAIKEALVRFPESDALYVLLGWVFKKEGSNKAIEAFRQAVRINPNNNEARRELRLLEMRGGLKDM